MGTFGNFSSRHRFGKNDLSPLALTLPGAWLAEGMPQRLLSDPGRLGKTRPRRCCPAGCSENFSEELGYDKRFENCVGSGQESLNSRRSGLGQNLKVLPPFFDRFRFKKTVGVGI